MASINAESEIGFASKLSKTRMCTFFKQGSCRKGKTCSFAHSLSDLQSRPNLHKTQLCLAFERSGTCRDGAACKYAHGEDELQATRKQAKLSNPSLNAQFIPVPVAMVVNAFGSGGAATTLLQPAKVVGIQPVQVVGLVNVPPKEDCLLKSEREDDIWSVQTNDEDFDLDLESLPSRSRQTSVWSWISETDSGDQAVPESDSSSQSYLPSDSGFDASEDVHLPVKQHVVQQDPNVPDLRLHKTKMCKFFIQGECTNGSQCKFAHDSRTLKARPNLLRTSLCLAFQRSGCCKMGDACKYAHGIDQRRSALQEESREISSEDRRSFTNSVESMFEEAPLGSKAPLASKQLTHEASGVVASYKNTFLHLRQKSPERKRRFSCY